MTFGILIATAFIIIASLAAGIFLIARPAQAIAIQKKFYERINWRMEPISLAREERNTVLMGLFLVCLALAVTGYTVIKIIKFYGK